MLIVGEKINSTIKLVGEAIQAHNCEFIQDLARRQSAAGAAYLDVNAGSFPSEEIENLAWLVTNVQQAVETPLCLDSPRVPVLERALALHRGKAMINSISAERERLDGVLPLVKQYEASVIALCCGRGSIPATASERLAHAETIVRAVEEHGIPLERVYFDPLVLPMSLGDDNGRVFLETLHGLKTNFPHAKTISGLSNVSHGLPKRRIINRAFLILALGAGMDAAILDPLDARLMSLARATELLAGRDMRCIGYLKAFRAGRLED